MNNRWFSFWQYWSEVDELLLVQPYVTPNVISVDFFGYGIVFELFYFIENGIKTDKPRSCVYLFMENIKYSTQVLLGSEYY